MCHKLYQLLIVCVDVVVQCAMGSAPLVQALLQQHQPKS